MKKTRRPRPLQWLRYVVQAIVAVYVLAIAIASFVGETWAANLHTICPFGGVANIYTYLADGGYVAKLHSAVFVMLLALVIGLVLTGKSFCGWICPLGSVQQALGWIGQRLWPRAYNRLPRWLERILHYLKWLVLVWVLVQTARTGRLIFQDWDPYYNLYHIWTDEIAISGYVVTGLTLVAALFVPRAFCRFACPLGAFNGIFNWFSFIGIKRDAKTCTDCGLCSKVCPVNIDICASDTIRSIECMRCLKCVDACPQNSRAGNTLKLHTWFSGVGRLRGAEAAAFTPDSGAAPGAAQGAAAGRTRRRSVSTWLFAGVAITAFVIPILVTNLTGDFEITGGRGGGKGGGEGRESTEPGALQEGEERDELGSVEEGDGDGGQTIRGSTTLAEIQAMGADIAEFLEEFGLPADTPVGTRLREIAEAYGFTMSDARAYVDSVR
ncbi:MAG: 4Fe-4S binding protein [Thermoleophilia bacterium]|nr:4Fe-4S binding protein [Thermoleophilia bacterium]